MKTCFTLVLVTILFFAACKKDTPIQPKPEPEKPTPVDNGKEPTSTATTEQLIADSIFLFSKEIYYWQDKIGVINYETFNPRQYVKSGDALATAEAVMASIRTFNEHDEAKQFSYAAPYDDGTASEQAATKETGYGFFVKAGWTNTNRFTGWYVNYVFPESAAGMKGVARGMKLAKVNGVTLKYDQASVDILNNMLAYETFNNVDAEFVKTSGDTLKTNIGISSYVPNSVLYSKVLTTNKSKKVGYFVYKFFDKLSQSRAAIDEVLQSFKNQSISSIIMDMRYNNGGYVETQDYLANRLAPISVNGDLMYTLNYNNILQTGNYVILQKRYPLNTFTEDDLSENFNTTNSLNLPKIYVIVSDKTASASELLINNLKAVLGKNLILIGDENTYGKPVGFFPIDLFKKVTFWTVSFMTKNNKNDSVSYSGFKPDYQVYDNVEKSWGDVTEDCTVVALNLIDGNTIAAQATSPRSVQSTRKFILKNKQSFMDNMLYLK